MSTKQCNETQEPSWPLFYLNILSFFVLSIHHLSSHHEHPAQ